MKSLKLRGLALITICLVLAMVFVTACSPPPLPPAPAPAPAPAPVIIKSPEPGAVMSVPNVGAPRVANVIYGSGFKPGETLKIVYYINYAGQLLENAVGEGAHAMKADDNGSFSVATNLPPVAGVYSIKVYDQEGNTRAVSVVVAEAPKK